MRTLPSISLAIILFSLNYVFAENSKLIETNSFHLDKYEVYYSINTYDRYIQSDIEFFPISSDDPYFSFGLGWDLHTGNFNGVGLGKNTFSEEIPLSLSYSGSPGDFYIADYSIGTRRLSALYNYLKPENQNKFHFICSLLAEPDFVTNSLQKLAAKSSGMSKEVLQARRSPQTLNVLGKQCLDQIKNKNAITINNVEYNVYYSINTYDRYIQSDIEFFPISSDDPYVSFGLDWDLHTGNFNGVGLGKNTFSEEIPLSLSYLGSPGDFFIGEGTLGTRRLSALYNYLKPENQNKFHFICSLLAEPDFVTNSLQKLAAKSSGMSKEVLQARRSPQTLNVLGKQCLDQIKNKNEIITINNVEKLQVALLLEGYNIEKITKQLNPNTIAAINSYKKDRNLTFNQEELIEYIVEKANLGTFWSKSESISKDVREYFYNSNISPTNTFFKKNNLYTPTGLPPIKLNNGLWAKNPSDGRETLIIDENFSVPKGKTTHFKNKVIFMKARGNKTKDIEVNGTLHIEDSVIIWEHKFDSQTSLRVYGELVVENSWGASGTGFWNWYYYPGSKIKLNRFHGGVWTNAYGMFEYSAINYSAVRMSLNCDPFSCPLSDSKIYIEDSYYLDLEIIPPKNKRVIFSTPPQATWVSFELNNLYKNTTFEVLNSKVGDAIDVTIGSDTHVTMIGSNNSGYGILADSKNIRAKFCEIRNFGNTDPEIYADRYNGKYVKDKTWNFKCNGSSLRLIHSNETALWPSVLGPVSMQIVNVRLGDPGNMGCGSKYTIINSVVNKKVDTNQAHCNLGAETKIIDTVLMSDAYLPVYGKKSTLKLKNVRMSDNRPLRISARDGSKIIYLNDLSEPLPVLRSSFNRLDISHRKAIQETLVKFRYSSTIDGVWGPGTLEAMSNYIRELEKGNQVIIETLFEARNFLFNLINH